MDYYVYILYSPLLDRYYVGQTKDIEERLEHHNSGRNKSTKGCIPWVMVPFEKVNGRAVALAKERQIKNQNLGSKRYLQSIGKDIIPEQSGNVS